MRTQRVGITLLAVLLFTGCASGMASSSGRQTDLITAEEIAATNVSNLHQLVQQLRPRWLDVRASRSFNAASEIVVFQGNTYLGGIEMLRQVGKDQAYALRYLDGPTAAATLPGLGTRPIEGAIVINPTR